MAKQEKIVTPKAQKAKTAAQKAKTAANIAAAAERLARLQAQQRLVNSKRAAGMIGSDQALLRLVDAEERKKEEQEARLFVERVLSGPHGDRVRKSLSLRGEPCKVAAAVREFIRVACLREAV